MTMATAMKLMPTLEPKMAAVSDRHWEKRSQAQTVTLTWSKLLSKGVPPSVTSTSTVYWPTSSSTREWSRVCVSGGGGGTHGELYRVFTRKTFSRCLLLRSREGSGWLKDAY